MAYDSLEARVSLRRLIVKPDHERSEILTGTKLLAKLVRGVLAGNLADAHTVENPFGRFILLYKNRRIGNIQPVAQALRIPAVPESAHLDGKESDGGVNPGRNHFHSYRHDSGAHRFNLASRGE